MSDVEKLLKEMPEGVKLKDYCIEKGINYRYAKNLRYKSKKKSAPSSNDASSHIDPESISSEIESLPSPVPIQKQTRQKRSVQKESSDDEIADFDVYGELSNTDDEFLKNMAKTQRQFDQGYNILNRKINQMMKIVTTEFRWETLDPDHNVIPPEYQDGSGFLVEFSDIARPIGEVLSLVNELELAQALPFSPQNAAASNLTPLSSGSWGENRSSSGVVVVQPPPPPQQSRWTLPHISLPKFGSKLNPRSPSDVIRGERVESTIDDLKQLPPLFNKFIEFYFSAYARVMGQRNVRRCMFDRTQLRASLIKFNMIVSAGAKAAMNHRAHQVIEWYKDYSKAKLQNAFMMQMQQRPQYVVGYSPEEQRAM